VTPRLTVKEAALAARKHEQTVRRALEDGRLHGTQQVTGGRWTVRADCLEAWCDGVPCEHQAAKVVPIASRRRTAS
jgi:hypothetical protein